MQHLASTSPMRARQFVAACRAFSASLRELVYERITTSPITENERAAMIFMGVDPMQMPTSSIVLRTDQVNELRAGVKLFDSLLKRIVIDVDGKMVVSDE